MKRLVGLLIVMVITLTMFTQAVYAKTASSYKDLSSTHWAYQHIDNVTIMKIMDGYPDGTFKPEKEVTLGEYLKMLVKIYSPTIVIRDPEPGEHWAIPYAEQLIPMLYFEVTFTPEELDAVISRGQMAKYTAVVNSWLRKKDNRIQQTNLLFLENMKDANEIPTIYRQGVDYCIRAEIINGFEDGTFRYAEGLTRAQAAKVIFLAKNNLTNGL